MKYRQQLDESDCGAACLAMIASQYGKSLSIAQVRVAAGTDVIGTNVRGLVEAAKEYGLKAFAVKGSKEAIKPSLEVPFVAHLHVVHNGDCNDYYDHYVVVKKIFKKRIEIWDPNGMVGKHYMDYTEFLENWSGYAVFFEPEECFKRTDEKQNLLIKFIPAILPHKKILLYSLLASVLLLAFGIVSSYYYKYVFDEVIFAKASASLNTLSFGVLFVTIVQAVMELVRSSLLSHFSFKTDLQLNFSYLSHIFKLPLSFFETRKSGEIMSRLGDLDKVRETLSCAALSGVMDVLMLLASGPILLNINGTLFGISFATVLLLAAISALFSKLYRRYYSKAMTQGADVQSYLYESINGVATVKALNAEDLVNEEYETKKMKATAIDWRINRFGITQEFLSTLINGVSGIFVFWLGCSNIIKGTMSFGTLLTFNALLGYFTGPLFRLVNIQNEMQESLVAAERVGEILELAREQQEDKNYIKPKKIEGHIKFENVTFAYGMRDAVYKDFSMEIEAGKWTAFVGASGSGKSTFVKLLLKFYEIQKGRIFLDGKDLCDIDTKTLRSKIGYVPQDIFLFSGSVRDNISLHNPDVSLDEIIDAAKKAGAHEFIEKLPKRYDTVLGEHGGGLSGGEKQRLALARALLGNPSLIILDEATSSLDTVSEMQIHNVIKQLKKENIAVILIAHRLTTVMSCDKIFVMQQGKIVEDGTHNELLSLRGEYYKMWTGAVSSESENYVSEKEMVS